MSQFYVGNADDEAGSHRGWFIGHFMEDGARRSDDVEIKWGVHTAGEKRSEHVVDEHRTTVLLLVRGRFRIDLSAGSHVLEREGDYAVWTAGIGHSWQAEEDSVVITVRWPSTS